MTVHTRTFSLLLALLAAAPALAGPPPQGARAGLPIAAAAARAWAQDAVLVYLENDEPPAGGAAERWSYLYVSASRDRARGYSVRGDRIAESATLDFRFDSLPLAEGWIDADAALAAAEEGPGAEYRELGGDVTRFVLVRSALVPESAGATTWLLVYEAPGQPSLFVVVDAFSARVLKSWRG